MYIYYAVVTQELMHASIEAKAKQYSTSGSTVHVIYHTIPPSHTQKACVSLHGNMARTLASKV